MRDDRTTVLVVDGDPDTVETLRGTDGMGVLAESDPEAALAAVEDAAVDCIVACGPVDADSKPASVERLQRSDRFADVPVVLYPEDGDATLVDRALDGLATDYVVDAGTPESRAVLRHRVRRAVESRRERQARRSGIDSRFFDIAESLAVGILSIDVDSRIQYANPAAADVFGYEPAELSGESLTRLIPERLRQDHLDAFERYLETGERNLDWSGVQLPGLHCSGEEVPVRIAFSEYEHRGDRYFTGTVIDVREQEQRRRELERQNERLERFASVVSHDLRNPLSVASGNVELVRETGELARLDRVDEALSRMDAMIDELLTLARGGQPIDDLSTMTLDSVARDAWRTADTGEATLSVTTDSEILASRGRLRTLLENLFRNSVEHGSTGGRTESGDGTEHAGSPVTVTLGELPDGFFVADDGPGIPEECREEVFEWGYSTTNGGTGFGLAIAAEVAEAHDWTIELTESDAGGARFEIHGVERP